MTARHVTPNSSDTEPTEADNELDKALAQVLDEVRAGLAHGFFDYSMSCEIVRGGKRRFTLRAGRSHRFVIADDLLD